MSLFTDITVIYIILLAPSLFVDYKPGGFYFTKWIGDLLPQKIKEGKYINRELAFISVIVYAILMGWFIVPILKNFLDTNIYPNGGDWDTFVVITFLTLVGFHIKHYTQKDNREKAD